MFTTFFSINIHEYTNIDPYHNIELTDIEREEIDREAKNAFIAHADDYLDKFGAEMIGNGDVIGPVNPDEYGVPRMSDDDIDDFILYLGFWDAVGIIDKWLAYSDMQY